MLLEIGHQPRGGARLTQVHRHRPGIAQRRRQFVEPLPPPRHQHQPLALGRQLPRELGAETGRGAGDQRHGRHQATVALRILPGLAGGSPTGKAST